MGNSKRSIWLLMLKEVQCNFILYFHHHVFVVDKFNVASTFLTSRNDRQAIIYEIKFDFTSLQLLSPLHFYRKIVATRLYLQTSPSTPTRSQDMSTALHRKLKLNLIFHYIAVVMPSLVWSDGGKMSMFIALIKIIVVLNKPVLTRSTNVLQCLSAMVVAVAHMRIGHNILCLKCCT